MIDNPEKDHSCSLSDMIPLTVSEAKTADEAVEIWLYLEEIGAESARLCPFPGEPEARVSWFEFKSRFPDS